MKRNILKGFLKFCAAAVLAAGLAGCSNLLETSENDTSNSVLVNGNKANVETGNATATLKIPNYAALAEQVSGARAVAPQTASVVLHSTIENTFDDITKTLSDGTKKENDDGSTSYSFTFTIPAGEYEAEQLQISLLDSNKETLCSGTNSSKLTITAGEANTVSITLKPVVTATLGSSGSLAADEMKFAEVTLAAETNYAVTVSGNVTLFLYDSNGKYQKAISLTGGVGTLSNASAEEVTYFIGIYSASAVESYSVSVAVPTVESITVKTNPTTTKYKVGGTLDLTGLVLTLNYSDKSTKELAYSETSGITAEADLSAAGTKTVTVTYDGKTTTFEVTVEAATVTTTLTPNSAASVFNSIPARTAKANVAEVITTNPVAEITSSIDLTGYIGKGFWIANGTAAEYSADGTIGYSKWAADTSTDDEKTANQNVLVPGVVSGGTIQGPFTITVTSTTANTARTLQFFVGSDLSTLFEGTAAYTSAALTKSDISYTYEGTDAVYVGFGTISTDGKVYTGFSKITVTAASEVGGSADTTIATKKTYSAPVVTLSADSVAVNETVTATAEIPEAAVATIAQDGTVATSTEAVTAELTWTGATVDSSDNKKASVTPTEKADVTITASYTDDNGDTQTSEAKKLTVTEAFKAASVTITNDSDTLGLVATTVESSDESIVKADLTTNSGSITLTSVAQGTAVVTFKDASNSGTIDVVVKSDGSIGTTVNKYSVAVTYTISADSIKSVSKASTTTAYIYYTAAGEVSETEVEGGFKIGYNNCAYATENMAASADATEFNSEKTAYMKFGGKMQTKNDVDQSFITFTVPAGKTATVVATLYAASNTKNTRSGAKAKIVTSITGDAVSESNLGAVMTTNTISVTDSKNKTTTKYYGVPTETTFTKDLSPEADTTYYLGYSDTLHFTTVSITLK